MKTENLSAAALPAIAREKPVAESGPLSTLQQEQVVRRITLRLIPLLFLCYIIAYVDRINVGFAKLQLQEVLGVDPSIFSSVFGFGAGLFFIGYFVFEIPSNLILQRVGARIWIARIMIVWGLVSAGFVFLKGVTMFYVMRFLLGAAEAGFFPGVILYMTYWYPPNERARIISLFAIGGVAAGVVGSPISGALLGLHGVGGLAGWQWLFLLEAIPALVAGVVILAMLPNGPTSAKWLSAAEKEWVAARLMGGRENPGGQKHTLSEVFRSPMVWLLCLVYFLMNVGSYGYEMWLPTVIKGMSGKGNTLVGLMSAIPYFLAGIAMYVVSRYSDLHGDRRRVVAISALSAAIGFTIAATAANTYVSFGGLILAFAGCKSTIAPFWAWTTGFLSATAAAGGIALINSVGNLGGFFGPTLVGIIKDHTRGNLGALLLLGGALLGMAVVTLGIPPGPTKKAA